MTPKNSTFFSLVWSLVCAVPAIAQQVDYPAISKADTLATSKESHTYDSRVVIDTMAMDMHGVEQMEKMASDTIRNDSALKLVRDGAIRKYALQDLPVAAKYDSLWMEVLYENASLSDEMFREVSQLDYEKTYPTSLSTDTLKARLKRLNQKTPFNIAYNPSLENVIKSFLFRKRELMERMLTVSQFYFPLFEQELDNHDIPLEMKYLAIVESALNPRARSRVGATGLWQFMYGTGKQYKLDVSSYVDERSDPIKSTQAASKFLSKLYDIYGDWDLVLAAYNSGPGNVNKAIRRSGGSTNYWHIRRFLPRETAGYVPAFLATMYLFEYADEHDLKGETVERAYFETDTVRVKNLITFQQISELVGVGEKELSVLNPSYKLNVIPFVEGEHHTLRLPRYAIGRFVANEAAIYAHVKKELESKESPLPELVEEAERNKIRYKVRQGDYLGKIAEQYGVGVSELRRWNGLRGSNLRVGQRLTIFPERMPRASAGNAGIPVGAKVHTVQRGDSLWTISKKYPGISVENLRQWNGISGRNLKPGTKLKLCACPS
ncbi:LysM peptidoglycan-binding domain-containing protein [Pricia sp. S334]|uniref:LysM peptidoglycan-binding domain-containing protein n=1 Tax=Pricia mediterranea TaxID=3076079 RepID=A0ABU3L593_9FLAO|nr:LysM peptidoglycan-binding domain-containing protein [Pricia sp. S334]MDT7828911.1 LysM peptidoglycan-binding domain-containing protein [Pricia sp. S334]